MLFLDMFFYEIYCFSTKKLKRDTDNATFSASAIMTLCIGFFTNAIAHIIGIIKNNVISRWSIDNAFLSAALISGCVYTIFLIRYFKFIDVEVIKKRISELPYTKRKIYQYIIYLFMITVPIVSYAFYRLYKFGHI